MAGLETLPDKLFTQILEDLPNSDLARTSLVSRRVQTISQPLLYREPHLKISDEYRTSLDLFFDTLLTPGCESLGIHARCLTVDWDCYNFILAGYDLPNPEAARAHPMLRGTHVSEISQVDVLLQLMPRLQSLHLPRLYCQGAARTWANPLHLDTLPPTLRHFNCQWPALTTANLLTILRLPRIQSVVLHTICGSPITAAELTLPAGISSLTHLTLHCGGYYPDWLHTILSIPRALTHFVLYYGWYEFARVKRGLPPLQHSLTSLVLDIRDAGPVWLRRGYPTSPIGCLRDWPALQTVMCPLRVLIASDSLGLAAMLPAGVRELEILDDDDVRVGEAVKEVVALLRAAHMVPALERVRVYAGRRKSKSLRKRLRKACWAVGVAFEDGSKFEMAEWC